MKTRKSSFNGPSLLPIIFSALFVTSVQIHAETLVNAIPKNTWHIGGIAGIALTFGGDELSRETVDRTFGGSDTETIDTGELIHFYGGVVASKKQYQVQATIGYHVDQINGDNGDTGFCRWPFELLGFYTFEKARIGAGISHHVNPEYERDVDGDPRLNADFDNATGFVIQADYLFGARGSSRAAVGIRYTDIEYEVESANFTALPGLKIDGSNVGINFSYLF